MSYSSNADLIQATIEIFGAIVTLVLSYMLVLMTGRKKKSEKCLFYTIITSAIALFADAGWYIFDGNTSSAGFFFNYGCNVLIFLTYPVMLAFAGGYISNLLKEDGVKYDKKLIVAEMALCGVSVIVSLSNFFTEWIWKIDERNIYHRLNGWFVFAGINLLTLFVLVVITLKYKKNFSRRKFITLLIFLFSPAVGAALQICIIGISFIQLGLGIGGAILLTAYVVDWILEQKRDNKISTELRNFWIFEIAFLIVILCISASIISSLVSVKQISGEEAQKDSTALTLMVSETIDETLTEPIVVSRTIARSGEVADAFSLDNTNGTDEADSLTAYLKRLREEYGYATVFAASDKTKDYYNPEGFARNLMDTMDTLDVWYHDFKVKGGKYELNIDEDKDDNMSLSVFVNMRVEDENGDFAGICGVGMSIERLMDILASYENEYNLEILLVNSRGQIQLSSDRNKIENEYIDLRYLYNVDDGSISYTRNDSEAKLVSYMEDLGWYLVVTDKNPDKINVKGIIFPSVLAYIISIVLMVATTGAFYVWSKKNKQDLKTTIRISETDELTGLANRYALNKYLEEIEDCDAKKAFAVIMIDINGLKAANDNTGHDAGDEIIRATAECANGAFAHVGKSYRIGGDEFIVICECGKSEVESAIDDFKIRVANWKGILLKELSASVGMASNEEFPEYSIHELRGIADKRMYESKEAYYRESGRERRKN